LGKERETFMADLIANNNKPENEPAAKKRKMEAVSWLIHSHMYFIKYFRHLVSEFWMLYQLGSSTILVNQFNFLKCLVAFELFDFPKKSLEPLKLWPMIFRTMPLK
jgi:hypothetical protein